MFHAISYSWKCKTYNRAVRNNFNSFQLVRSLTFVDCSGQIATQDNSCVNSYLKYMSSVKILYDVQVQKMAFLNFSTDEYVNKDENLTNINRKPNSRIWREFILIMKPIEQE